MMKNYKRRIQAEFGNKIIESNPKVIVLDYKFVHINVVLDDF